VPAGEGSLHRLVLLRLWRIVDKSAFICVGCGKVKRGWGERIGYGWACSWECSQLEIKRQQQNIPDNTQWDTPTMEPEKVKQEVML
jgi:hypothetical protein